MEGRDTIGKSAVQVHDLLRLCPESGDLFDRPLPLWAQRFLRETPWVVVRRGERSQGIPIGIRGGSKQQRFGCILRWKRLDGIAELKKPDQILAEALTDQTSKRGERTEIWEEGLGMLKPLMHQPYYGREVKSIGIGGSIGFELASGRKVSSPDSDLDLIITISPGCGKALCRRICAYLEILPVAADAVLVTRRGWTSLREYAGTDGPVLMKTMDGCILTRTLW